MRTLTSSLMAEQESFLRSCRDHPEYFVENVLGDRLHEKQIEIIRALYKHRRVAVPAGHGVGKSHLAGRVALQFLCTHPDSIVITTAPTQRQVRKVLWGEIHSAYNKSKFPLGGELYSQELRYGPSHYALGLTTSEPDKFQGIHPDSGYILIILDEAPGIPAEIWEAAEGLMSCRCPHILAIGNPTSSIGPFKKACTDGTWKVIPLSCMDSPNVKSGKVLIDGLVTREWVMEKAQQWGEDSNIFRSRVLGEFPLEGDGTLIPLNWIMNCVNNRKYEDASPVGPIRLGVDVARHGSDSTVLLLRQGHQVLDIAHWNGKDTMETVGRVRRYLKGENSVKIQIDPRNVWVDDGGVGGGVVDRLREERFPINSTAFGARAGDPTRFINWRSQAFWTLREEFEQGLISIPHNDRLIGDLAQLTLKDRSDGRIQIMPKHEMKRKGMDSPDFADALALASQGEITRVAPKRFEKDSVRKSEARYFRPRNIIQRALHKKKRWRGISAV